MVICARVGVWFARSGVVNRLFACVIIALPRRAGVIRAIISVIAARTIDADTLRKTLGEVARPQSAALSPTANLSRAATALPATRSFVPAVLAAISLT